MRNRKLFLRRREVNVTVGGKLLFAGLALALGNFILAGMVMMLPGAWVAGILATGSGGGEDPTEKIMEAVEKKIKQVLKETSKDNVDEEFVEKKIKEVNKLVQKLSEEGIEKLKERMDKMAQENAGLASSLEEATEALKTQGEALKKLTDKNADPAKQEVKSFREALKDAILEFKDTVLKEKNDDNGKRLSMKDFFKKNQDSPTFTIKALVDMFETNIVGASVQQMRLTDLDPTRVGIPLNIYRHVTSIFNIKSISRPYMALMVVYEYENGAGTKAEGVASTKSSFKFKTVDFKSFYIATHFVLSEETLDDLEEALDEISIVAPDKIHDDIDNQLLGDAGDDAAAIAGILTANKHTAYAAQRAGQVESASIIDVIADAKLQAESNRRVPTHVFLNPTDIANIAGMKNTLEDSKSDRRVVFNALGEPVSICGLLVLKNSEIVSDTCIVFDMKMPWIGRRRDMEMEIGRNGTDLVEGQKTVVIKVRIAFGVRDKGGIIFVDGMAAAAAALTAA